MCRDPAQQFDLVDLHQNYESKEALTCLGGYWQQLYFVVCAILKTQGNDLSQFYERKALDYKAAKKPITARELLIEEFFLPFLAQNIRDMKSEGISTMVTAQMAQKLAEIDVKIGKNGEYELHKMTKEQYLKFRYYFIEQRAFNPSWIANKNEVAMDLVLGALTIILCKKVPTECDLKKIEKLHEKTRLLSRPEKAEDKPLTCVVMLSFAHDKQGKEVNNGDKALAVNNRASKDHTVAVLNCHAARAARKEILNQMTKQVPGAFKNSEDQAILKAAERLSNQHDRAFIDRTCSEFEVPFFDIPTDANLY